jgi:hypothetical protein
MWAMQVPCGLPTDAFAYISSSFIQLYSKQQEKKGTYRRNEKLPLFLALSVFHGLRVDQARVWRFCEKTLRFARNREMVQHILTAQETRSKYFRQTPQTKFYIHGKKRKF